MSQYKFVTDGNFVNYYIDAQLVLRLHNSSRCVTWGYNESGGVNYTIDDLRYQIDNLGEIYFNGVQLATQPDFETKIIELFPGLAGSGGGGGGGVSTVGDPVTAITGKGGVISGSTLTLFEANNNFGGLLSGGAQQIKGSKTFNDPLITNNQLRIEDDARFRSQDASGFFATLSAPNLTANRTVTIKDVNAVIGAGLDDVLAQAQNISADRLTLLNSFILTFRGGPIHFDGEGHYSSFFTDTAKTCIALVSLNEYADNTAALADGVPNGGVYYTTDGTERILKVAHD